MPSPGGRRLCSGPAPPALPSLRRARTWLSFPGNGRPGRISLIVSENADGVIFSVRLPGRCQYHGSSYNRGTARIRLFRLWPASTSLFPLQLPLPLVLIEQRLLKAVYPIRAPRACVTHSLAACFWMHLPNIHCSRPRGQEISICSGRTIKKHPNPEEPMSQQNPGVTHQH